MALALILWGCRPTAAKVDRLKLPAGSKVNGTSVLDDQGEVSFKFTYSGSIKPRAVVDLVYDDNVHFLAVPRITKSRGFWETKGADGDDTFTVNYDPSRRVYSVRLSYDLPDILHR